MPLFRRHKILLGILLDAPRCPTHTELMKWLFLLKKDTFLSSDTSFYDFIPYKFGPFSFTVYRDIEELAQLGYLEGSNLRVQPALSHAAKRAFQSLPTDHRDAIKSVLSRYGFLPQARLIDSIYERFPWFASRSVLKMKSSPSSKLRRRAAYTAGYEGASIDTFLQKLMKAGIERVVDVRNNPVSRKYGFFKDTLYQLSKKVAIDYIHLPALGIPSSDRRSLVTFDDYQALMDYYETSILPRVPEARGRAALLLQERPSALVCFESDQRCCHRSRLAGALSADTGLEVIHL